MEIDVHYSTVKNQQAAEKRQGRNSRETAQQVGTIIPGDDSGPEKKHISGDSNSQDPSSDGIEEQENSTASHQVQINPGHRLFKQSIQDPLTRSKTHP